MPIIAPGALRTTLIVDMAVMVAAMFAFIGWRILGQRAALNSTLSYSILAMIPRAALPLFLLFDFSLFPRGDGFDVYWIRWVIYAFAWGFGGLLHALIHLSAHKQYYWRWAASMPLFVAYTLMAIGAKQAIQDQRLVLLILSAVCLSAVAFVLVCINRTHKMRVSLLLWSEAVLLLAGVVFYALGHSMYRTIAIEWESVAYLCIDFLAFPVGLFLVNILHCPCPGGGDRLEEVPLTDSRQGPQNPSFVQL